MIINQNLQEQFIATRNHTLTLCNTLSAEDMTVQAAEFTSPTKWHLAHTSWFFEAFVLSKYKHDYKTYHADFSFLFNSYYNNVGPKNERANRGLITRPALNVVLNYRKYINHEILELLANDKRQEVLAIVELGINHEQQHQELIITDIKYTLSKNPILPAYNDSVVLENFPAKNEHNQFISLNGGLYPIGFDGHSFSFDNEHGVHQVYLNEFQIANKLVSNNDYLNFINDGGYSNFNLWHDEGWAWVNAKKANAPLYWKANNGAWTEYTLSGLQDLELRLPVNHVNYYEASAYAQWAGMRLPTEFEWEAASSQLNWGARWEWTNSAYLPYPSYKKANGAVGEYNGKFMINQMVLRGASIATSKGHSRASYRNFFHPKFQWQFSGIRLAK